MEIVSENYNKKEQNLIDITNRSHNQYDKAYLSVLQNRIMRCENGNSGFFKVFAYKNSLRFCILFDGNPESECIDYVLSQVNEYVKNTDKDAILLWYSQRENFSDVFINMLDMTDEPYRFSEMALKRGMTDINISLDEMQKTLFDESCIDECIDLLESAYTPFLDSPGSYKSDRERLMFQFNNVDKSRTEVFSVKGKIVGMYCHENGNLECICVHPDYQGKGYGEIILRSAVKAIFEDCENEPRLTVANKNMRAISLYKKAGFERVYESARVRLKRDNSKRS